MTEKEEQVLNEIKLFYKENKLMPTIRYLKKELNYQSNYSIQLYLKKLEKLHYLKRNINNKLILNENLDLYNNINIIKIINSKDELHLTINSHKQYLAYQIKNNDFIKDNIKKNDILIIEKTKKVKDNDLCLLIIDKKYRIMKYFYKDGFYLLKDKEEIILNRVKIIGKVIMLERKI